MCTYFVRRERGATAPILPVDLLAQPIIGLSAIGGFIAFSASMTLLISTPFRLQALGFSAAAIGACIAPWPMTNMIVAPLAALLALGIGTGATPPFIAAGLALVAGPCSVARLRPSIRNPTQTETEVEVRVLKHMR